MDILSHNLLQFSLWKLKILQITYITFLSFFLSHTGPPSGSWFTSHRRHYPIEASWQQRYTGMEERGEWEPIWLDWGLSLSLSHTYTSTLKIFPLKTRIVILITNILPSLPRREIPTPKWWWMSAPITITERWMRRAAPQSAKTWILSIAGKKGCELVFFLSIFKVSFNRFSFITFLWLLLL